MIPKKILPLVSVIIPTTDTDKMTKYCIDYVKRSTYENIQIIVVNEGLERSEQRNIGMQRAKGDYYLILDSDQMVSRFLIEECVNLCHYNKHFNFDAVYIPERITTEGFFGYLRDWERQFYTATCIDVVRFVRAENCPMFDVNQKGTEDSDWDRRIDARRAVCQAPVMHLDNIGVLEYFKKKAYYAKSLKVFEKRNQKDKILNFWWRCFGVYFEKGKWKRVVKRPDLFICLMGVVFLRGIIYIWQKIF